MLEFRGDTIATKRRRDDFDLGGYGKRTGQRNLIDLVIHSCSDVYLSAARTRATDLRSRKMRREKKMYALSRSTHGKACHSNSEMDRHDHTKQPTRAFLLLPVGRIRYCSVQDQRKLKTT